LASSRDPFNGYDDPTVFGPDYGWEAEIINLTSTNTNSETPSLDSEAELTHLLPGLLDSPPTEHKAPPPTSAIQSLCANITAVAPAALLPTPLTIQPSATPPATLVVTHELSDQGDIAAGVAKRRSSRLAASLPDTSKAGERACSVKLNKWGINEEDEDKTMKKKKQLLALHQGPHGDMAANAINDLLGLEAQCS
jgi:hypothetical protein